MEGAKIVMMKDEYEGISKDTWMKEAPNRESILATFPRLQSAKQIVIIFGWGSMKMTSDD